MRRLDKISRRRLEEIIREEVEFKATREAKERASLELFESRMRDVRRTIFEGRQDLESKIVIKYLENNGATIKNPMSIDEGLWDKAKNMLAKLRLSKSTGAEAERDKLQSAADDAASAEFNTLFSQLKSAPGFDKYPNNTNQEDFDYITMGLGLLWNALDSAHKAGLVETDTANNLIDNLKGYVEGLNKDLSYSYRYLKEEDGEIEQLDEKAFTNYNKVDAMLDALQKGTDIGDKNLEWLGNQYMKLDKEFMKKGGEAGMELDPSATRGWTNKESDLHARMQDMFGLDGSSAPTPDPSAAATGGGGGGGGGATSPDELGPELGPEMDPEMPDEFGNFSDDGSLPGDFATSAPTGPGGPSVGATDLSSLGDIYGQAGDVAARAGELGIQHGAGHGGGASAIGKSALQGTMAYLGPGFMNSLAGFALPVAGIGAVLGLVGKRVLGHSREGALKNTAKTMVPLDAGDYSTEQEKLDDAAAEKAADPALDALGGGDAGAGAAGAAGGEAGTGEEEGGGRGDIYVFKNPADGQGMQSKLSKGGIKGKDMSRLMKGLRADLTGAGFNVLEEAKRETISLEQTLAAIEQMEDQAQKEIAKKAVVDMLRQHDVRLDPQSSLALKAYDPTDVQLRPGEPGATAPPPVNVTGGDPASDPQGEKFAQMAKSLAAGEGTGNKIPDPGPTPGHADAVKKGVDQLKALKGDDTGGGDASGQSAESEPCKPGFTRNKEGACVPFGTPGINETLQRWQKIAGIIKG